MTTELQDAAVELQQSEEKRAELLPDEVEKAVTAFKFCISLIRDECLWSAGSFDKPHITTKNLKDVMAHIAAQSSEIERLRDAIIQYVICCPADRDTTNDFLKASYKLDEVLAQGAKNEHRKRQ